MQDGCLPDKTGRALNIAGQAAGRIPIRQADPPGGAKPQRRRNPVLLFGTACIALASVGTGRSRGPILIGDSQGFAGYRGSRSWELQPRAGALPGEAVRGFAMGIAPD